MGLICNNERGKRGKRGEQGERGEAGERGERGHRGHTGPTGPTGPIGPTGPTGATGSTGSIGSTGATGTTGPSSGAFLGRVKFTADGMWVPIPGTMKVHVVMCGGGASGNGPLGTPTLTSVGGGGASGAGLDFDIESLVPITGGPVVIGLGGVGVLGGSNPGTPTSVVVNGTTYVADHGFAGGGAGTASGFAIATGGSVGPGSTPFGPLDGYTSGDNGSPGFVYNAPNAFGGDGGSGDYGIGGSGSSGSAGQSATGYGAGGGGTAGTTTSLAGGSGAPGFAIFEMYS